MSRVLPRPGPPAHSLPACRALPRRALMGRRREVSPSPAASRLRSAVRPTAVRGCGWRSRAGLPKRHRQVPAFPRFGFHFEFRGYRSSESASSVGGQSAGQRSQFLAHKYVPAPLTPAPKSYSPPASSRACLSASASLPCSKRRRPAEGRVAFPSVVCVEVPASGARSPFRRATHQTASVPRTARLVIVVGLLRPAAS